MVVRQGSLSTLDLDLLKTIATGAENGEQMQETNERAVQV